MKSQLCLSVLIASTLVSNLAHSANFGSATSAVQPGAKPVVTEVKPVTTLTPTGPQVGALFRVVKTDGATVIQQGALSNSTSNFSTINVTDKDAFLVSGGKCAFNVRYDMISMSAATNITNRLFSNDTPIAVNSKIDLLAGVAKSIWTQPYLTPGVNNVRVVVNADSTKPDTKWLRINVAGTCGAVTTPPKTTPPSTTPPKVEQPKPPVTNTSTSTDKKITPPVVIRFTPGSAEWNNLNNAWGYTNFGVKQLKGKGYSRYDELVRLNAAIAPFIAAKTIDQGAYNSIITSWNTFVTEPKFRELMSAVVPSTAGSK